jgi:spermidine/putrescine transport system permease protein
MDTQMEEASAGPRGGTFDYLPPRDAAADHAGGSGRLSSCLHHLADDVVITYFISGVDSQTLPLFIFSMMRRGIKPEINAIAMLLVVFSFVVAATGLFLRSRHA